MSILYIGMEVKEAGGYTAIHNRNIYVLEHIFGKVFFIGLTSNTSGSMMSKLLSGWKGNYFRISNKIISNILGQIEQEKPLIIFIGNSLSAYIIKIIKKRYPLLLIVSFFHNCECHYFTEELKQDRFNLIHLFHIIFSFRSERIAVKYSDYLWGLNQRDSNLIKKIYGKAFDLLLPTSFVDKSNGSIHYRLPNSKLCLLFVGTSHYANVHGLNWFIENVFPFIEVKLIIVGNGMKEYYAHLKDDNIEIVGFVDDLEEYYYKSNIIISPIFLGGGMKTKTAEAMMYSMPIIGTKEAFIGYDINADRIGAQCDSAKQFIYWINYYDKYRASLINCSKYSRSQFEEKYSIDSSIDNTRHFFNIKRILK
jgi:hypothetical protein